MKKAVWLLVVCVPLACAQQAPRSPARAATNPVERAQGPAYSDMYCAGFISQESYDRSNLIVAGEQSPNATQFRQGDRVFLQGSYQEGARLSVLRALRDPNRSRAFAGQAGAISELGQPYAELGRLRVTAIRDKTAIAVIEFSCAPIVAGDLAVPFQDKPAVMFRGKTAFDRFPAGEGSVTARIVLAKDFDYVLGTGSKVYLSAGADKGVKVGDYFRAVRDYDPHNLDYVEALSYKARQSEETQKYSSGGLKANYAELPRRAVAEMIVINVSPTSSTAMITFAVEDVMVGDTVELEGGGAQQ